MLSHRQNIVTSAGWTLRLAARARHLAYVVAAPAYLSAQSIGDVEARNAAAARVRYEGRDAVQLIAPAAAVTGESYARVGNVMLQDGVIEVEVAGRPSRDAGPGARGFIGLAFRLADGAYEHFYIRPTNGRAPDQIRRNHATQYAAHPDYGFERLRRESPEQYESYVDLEPGVWTKLRIEVSGRTARLFVHGATQPALIVNDLKHEPRVGGVALWVGPGTEGYFANLRVTPAAAPRR